MLPRASLAAFLSLFSCFLQGTLVQAEQGDWDDPSWQLLREAHIHRDGASLAAYLREQCGDETALSRLDVLVRQLGSDDFEEREQASKALPTLGAAALAKLRVASGSPDTETARRAAECVAKITAKWKPELALAAVRVLIRRAPPEATATLLRFLPYADFEELQDEIWFGMDALAVRQQKVDPSLVEALRDAVPVRRAAAACIVGRRGEADQRGAVRKLLTDAEAEVGLRAAQGLLAGRDAAGLETLTALLEQTPVETAWQAEELLRYVAGADAPNAIIGAGSAEDRKECRKAWQVWFAEQGARVDFAKLDQTSRRPGLMLLCDGGLSEEATGRVWLLGCDGVTRWDLRKLSYPADARLMEGGRVIVAERGLTGPVAIPLALPPRKVGSVGAYGFDGKAQWRYQGIDRPTLCKPLLDGHILVAGQALRVAGLDASGNEFTHKDFEVESLVRMYQMAPPSSPIVACRLNKSTFAYEWVEIEPTSLGGMNLLSPLWSTDRLLGSEGLTLQLVENDLVVEAYASRVTKFDLAENPVHYRHPAWEQWIPGVLHAAELPNRAVLAGGMGRAVEIDADGRAVWSMPFEDQAQRVRPCMDRVRLGFDARRAELDLGARPSDWLKGLESKDFKVRCRCANAIPLFGPWAVEASLPSLAPLVNDANKAVCDAAQQTLNRLKPNITQEMVDAMRLKDPRAQEDAALRFYEGRCPSKVVETLILLLKDEDPKIRWWAANLLSAADRDREKVIPGLIAAVRDDEAAEVRQMASHTLGGFGKEAKAAIPMLLECVKKHAGSKDSGWSMLALGEIDPLDDRVFPVLIEAVQAKDANFFAARALGRCAKRVHEAVPALVKALETEDDRNSPEMVRGFRSSILEAVGRLGPEARAAIPALIRVLQAKEKDQGLKLDAIHALASMGSAAMDAIEALQEIQRDRANSLEGAAAEALRRIRDDD